MSVLSNNLAEYSRYQGGKYHEDCKFLFLSAGARGWRFR